MNYKARSTLEKMRKKLRFRNYSKQTEKTYLSYAEKFLNHFSKDVYHISVKEAKNYLETFNYSSVSQQNQIINSVKFLYREVVGSKLKTLNVTRPRKKRKLPNVIDKDFLISRIKSISNKKHKAILWLAYSTGMRVSEVVNLKINDIDSKRMIIHIRNTKGRKDRIVPLSHGTLDVLRGYFKEYKPTEYLFNGQLKNTYSTTSCNKIVKKYLGHDKHFHLLRHSSFTSMLDGGTDLRIIQGIAGHKNYQTTTIYTHLSLNSMRMAQVPI